MDKSKNTTPTDDLSESLLAIIADSGKLNPKSEAVIVDKSILMEKLVIYVVERDHKIREHFQNES